MENLKEMSWKRGNPHIRLRPLISIVPFFNSHQVWLDIGTGDGLFAELLQRHLPVNTIIRCDISNSATYGDLGMKSYLEKPAIRSKSLTGIVCSQILHYKPYQEQSKIISYLNQLLIRDGMLLIIEYNTDRSHSWIPYPIKIDKLKENCLSSDLWIYGSEIKIQDGNRPKYSLLLKNRK